MDIEHEDRGVAFANQGKLDGGRLLAGTDGKAAAVQDPDSAGGQQGQASGDTFLFRMAACCRKAAAGQPESACQQGAGGRPAISAMDKRLAAQQVDCVAVVQSRLGIELFQKCVSVRCIQVYHSEHDRLSWQRAVKPACSGADRAPCRGETPVLYPHTVGFWSAYHQALVRSGSRLRSLARRPLWPHPSGWGAKTVAAWMEVISTAVVTAGSAGT